MRACALPATVLATGERTPHRWRSVNPSHMLCRARTGLWTRGRVRWTRHGTLALLEVLAAPVPVLVAVLGVLAVMTAVLAVLEMLATVLVVLAAVRAAVLETLAVLAAGAGHCWRCWRCWQCWHVSLRCTTVSLRCAACAGRLASELAGVQQWCWTRGRGAGAGRLPCRRHALGMPASCWQTSAGAQHRRHRLGLVAGAHSRPPHHARNAHTAGVLLHMPRRASSAKALDGLVAHAALH